MKRLLYEIRNVELDLYNWSAHSRHQVVHFLLAPWKTINDTRYHLFIVYYCMEHADEIAANHLKWSASSRWSFGRNTVWSMRHGPWRNIERTIIGKRHHHYLVKTVSWTGYSKMFSWMNWNWIHSAAVTSIFCKALTRLVLNFTIKKPSHISTYPNLGCFVHWSRCKYSCPCFGWAYIKNCILVSNERRAWEFYPTCLIMPGRPKALLDHCRHLWSCFIICFL